MRRPRDLRRPGASGEWVVAGRSAVDSGGHGANAAARGDIGGSGEAGAGVGQGLAAGPKRTRATGWCCRTALRT